MALLQKKLRTDLPYGKVFQGTGETDPLDKDLRFFQHGLYFKANGDLAHDSPRNAEKMALIKKLEINPDEPQAPVQEPDRAVVNPEVVAALGELDDDAVYATAIRLIGVKVELNEDYGDYEPSVDAREENIHFIAKYTS